MGSYNKFLEELERNRTQKRKLMELEKSLNDEIQRLDDEYHTLVVNGKEKESDEVFDRLYEKKKELEKTRRKLEIYNSTEDIPKNILDVANKAADELQEEIHKRTEVIDGLKSELYSIKEQYLKKLSEIGQALRDRRVVQEDMGEVLPYTNGRKIRNVHPKLGYQPLNRTLDQQYNLIQGEITQVEVLQALRGGVSNE